MENKNRNTAAIGVFDSGVGGISVLRELVAQMPNENYIFFGDSKNAPYGTKTLEEVQKLTCADAEYLLSRGVKALVVACNTATSAAIRILREKYADMPVIGIEPALKPAVHAGGHPRVLVMATPMTLREEKFHALMQRFESDAEILRLPCPGLVEYVEQGVLEGAIPLSLANSGIRAALGKLFTWKFSILLSVIALSVLFYRPFCKWLCPLGAFYALFNRVSLFQMKVDKNKCVSCGKCAKACKMDVDVTKTPNHAECIRCGMCVRACPTSAVSFRYGFEDGKKEPVEPVDKLKTEETK